MEIVYEEDRSFTQADLIAAGLPRGEYENCEFDGCNLSASDLSDSLFSECRFTACNLSTAKLNGASFRDVRFKNCKMLGLRFYDCSEFLFAVDFENCQLDLSSFFKLKIKNTRFKDCALNDADFSAADLTKVNFDNCDLRGASFLGSILEKTDFRTAYNYSLDPESNRVKGARFSREGIAGLLGKYEIEIE